MENKNLPEIEKEVYALLEYAKEKENEMSVFRDIWVYSETAQDRVFDLISHLEEHFDSDKMNKYRERVQKAMNAISIPKWLDKQIDNILESNRTELDGIAKKQALLLGYSEEKVQTLTWRQWTRE